MHKEVGPCMVPAVPVSFDGSTDDLAEYIVPLHEELDLFVRELRSRVGALACRTAGYEKQMHLRCEKHPRLLYLLMKVFFFGSG